MSATKSTLRIHSPTHLSREVSLNLFVVTETDLCLKRNDFVQNPVFNTRYNIFLGMSVVVRSGLHETSQKSMRFFGRPGPTGLGFNVSVIEQVFLSWDFKR